MRNTQPEMKRLTSLGAASLVFALSAARLWAEALAASPPLPLSPSAPLDFDCGYIDPFDGIKAVRAAVAAGLIDDPAQRPLPAVRPLSIPPAASRGAQEVTPADIFPFEDTEGLLLTNFTNGQLFNFMGQASNALTTAVGDNFDFVGFFLNFAPHHQVGSAFYLGLENDTLGLNIPLFTSRHLYGVAGENIEGWVMMWNQFNWEAGDSERADLTQLVLGQEFEHRFGVFLRPMPGGRMIQGDNASCGRGAHWNWRVDGQGSGMEMREWIGANPAVLGGDCVSFAPDECFNSDIGGVWSYPDLYLMGYVSAEEMDTGASELRYMDASANCASPYSGAISHWTSDDIISSNGVRVPDWTAAQKHFRAGWIMIHQPGAPPTEAQLANVAAILNQFTDAWSFGSLGRGSVDFTIFRDCNSNGVRDVEDIAAGTSQDCDGNLVPDECQPDCNSNGQADACEILAGTALDCQPNGVPDECDLAPGGGSIDCTGNGIPDECETDCNTNGIRDDCDIASGTSGDCNTDGIPDECDIAQPGRRFDCNTNGEPDGCDVVTGASADCNTNGIPDECDAWVCESLWSGFEPIPPFSAGTFIDGLDTDADGSAWFNPGSSGSIAFQGCPASTGKALKVVAQPPLAADVLISEFFSAERTSEDEFGPGAPVWSLSFDARSEAFLNPRIDWQFTIRDGNTDRTTLLIHWASTQSNYPGVTSAQGGDGRGRILVKNPGAGASFINTGFVLSANVCYGLEITLDNILNRVELSINGIPRVSTIPLEPKAFRMDYFRLDQVANGQSSGGLNRFALDNFTLCRRGGALADTDEIDCDANAVLDECDLTAGTSLDCNANARPDQCETPADFDGDGSVNAADYPIFAACFTAVCDAICEPALFSDPCCARADFNADGDVDLADFAEFQFSVGPIP